MSGVNLQRTSTGWQRGVATLLLVLQVTVGTAVTLAHAAESTGGPTALETHHTAQCVVLHDAARCAQCQFDSTRIMPAATRRARLPSATGRRLSRRPAALGAPTRVRSRTGRPRAPPAPLS
jgi:hypothetical protein